MTLSAAETLRTTSARARHAAVAALWLLMTCCGGSEAPKEGRVVINAPPAERASTSRGGLQQRGQLKFKALTRDFGDVDDTEELHHDFEFTNTGEGVLLIREIKASCGCTTTHLEKMEYQPGESGSIELNFHPKGYGPQTKTITVKSNAGDNQRVVLYVKAKVTPFVQFEPRAVRFDQVPATEGRAQEVKVSCRDTDAVFGGPTCTHPSFVAEWVAPPENGEGTLAVRLKAGAQKGNAINRVKFDVQGVTKEGAAPTRVNAELSVSAAVFGEIIIEPVFVSVGRVDPGGKVDKSVVLRRPNGEPFKLLSSELRNPSPPNLTVSTVQSGSRWTVRVQGDAGTYQGLVRGSVLITTDVPGDPTLTIPVMGAIRPDPKK